MSTFTASNGQGNSFNSTYHKLSTSHSSMITWLTSRSPVDKVYTSKFINTSAIYFISTGHFPTTVRNLCRRALNVVSLNAMTSTCFERENGGLDGLCSCVCKHWTIPFVLYKAHRVKTDPHHHLKKTPLLLLSG
jgi:hypothetical protein